MIAKVFDILELLFVLFTKSTKRNKELKEKLEKVKNVLMLRNLSKTRWGARVKSVQAIWRSLKAIVDTFVSLENSKDRETKTKASGLLNSVRNIDFLCGFMIWKILCLKQRCCPIIYKVRPSDTAGALVALSTTHEVLKRIPADDNEINNEIEAAVLGARNFGMEPDADFRRLHRLRSHAI